MSIISTKHFLIPVDFSPDSDKALNEGLDLAKQLGASLTVLHVIHDPLENPGFYQTKKKKQKRMLQYLDEIAAEKMAEFVSGIDLEKRAEKLGVKLNILCLRGLPVDQILNLAAKGKFGLVIMGSSGKSGLASVLLGSVTERVVQRSTTPVLVVTSEKNKKNPPA